MSRIIEIEITDISVEGRGVGRYDGKVVFVEQALPGDRVAARIVERGRAFDRAKVDRFLSKSKHRRTPICRSQDRCDGCPLMPLGEDAAVEVKVRHLEQVLRRVGKIERSVDRIVRSPAEVEYRNRVRFALDRGDEGWRIGFRRRGSGREFVAVDRCHLLPRAGSMLARDFAARLAPSARIDEIIVRHADSGRFWLLACCGDAPPTESLRRAAAASFEANEGLVGIAHHCRRSGEAAQMTVLAGNPVLEEVYGSIRVPVSSSTFLQVNTAAAERLYDVVRAFVSGEHPPSRVLDLFCGVGMIALLCCAPETSVLGVERQVEAVESGRTISSALGRDNVRLIARAAEDYVDQVMLDRCSSSAARPFDVVVLNPPRAGAGQSLAAKIVQLAPERIVMVSCHDAAMARDLAVFSGLGYGIEKLVAVDLFPQTTHLEAVALIEPEKRG